MHFLTTEIEGIFLIEPERRADERGFFARTWCEREFRQQGLPSHFVQCSVSYNHLRGTLRGMHYQRAPYGEYKVVRCNRGAIFDVAIDLRSDSPTHCRWVGFELNEENGRMLYIPEGCAHGFITLVDRTELYYQISEFYHPESVAGVRWDDPAFGIQWPIKPAIISPRDASFPLMGITI